MGTHAYERSFYDHDYSTRRWPEPTGITPGSPAFKYVVFDVNLPRDPVAGFNDAMDAVNYLNAHANPNLVLKLQK